LLEFDADESIAGPNHGAGDIFVTYTKRYTRALRDVAVELYSHACRRKVFDEAEDRSAILLKQSNT
jgi:hypothetical protein